MLSDGISYSEQHRVIDNTSSSAATDVFSVFGLGLGSPIRSRGPVSTWVIGVLGIVDHAVLDFYFLKFLVDHSLGRLSEIRFDCRERIPAADSYDNPQIHCFVDEQSLRELSTEIITRYPMIPFVTRLLSSFLCRSNYHLSNAAGRQVDKRVFGSDVLGVLVALDIALDAVGKEHVSRFPTVAGGILPRWDVQSVLVVPCRRDPVRTNLWDFECTEPNVRPELDD